MYRLQGLRIPDEGFAFRVARFRLTPPGAPPLDFDPHISLGQFSGLPFCEPLSTISPELTPDGG